MGTITPRDSGVRGPSGRRTTVAGPAGVLGVPRDREAVSRAGQGGWAPVRRGRVWAGGRMFRAGPKKTHTQ